MLKDFTQTQQGCWFMSRQPQDLDLFKHAVRKEFPSMSDAAIDQAIQACRKASSSGGSQRQFVSGKLAVQH